MGIEGKKTTSSLSITSEFAGTTLVVSDVVMPLLDGIGLCQQVKKTFPHIPVLLISGNEPNACRVGVGF
jgi:CheY-like chemotaxis protein